jgi:hypothetical protein
MNCTSHTSQHIGTRCWLIHAMPSMRPKNLLTATKSWPELALEKGCMKRTGFLYT